MFRDYEEVVREMAEEVLEKLDMETVIDCLGMTPAEAISKLVMDGHVDEDDLRRLL